MTNVFSRIADSTDMGCSAGNSWRFRRHSWSSRRVRTCGSSRSGLRPDLHRRAHATTV